MKNKVSKQLSKIFIGVSVLIFLALFITLDIFMNRVMKDQVIEEMKSQVLLVNESLINIPNDSEDFEEPVFKLASLLQSRITIIDSEGKVLIDSEADAETLENHFEREELVKSRNASNRLGTSIRFSDSVKKDLVYVVFRTSKNNYVRVARDLGFVEEIIFEVRLIFVLTLFISSIIFSFSVIYLSRRISFPLIELTETTKQIEAGNYEIEIKSDSDNEIGVLANSLNLMVKTLKQKISDLERLQQIRKDFVGNASHELRTPIAAIKGFTESLIDGALESPEITKKFLERTQANVKRLEIIVDDLLELTQLEGGNREFSPRFYNVAESIRETTFDFEQIAKEKGLSLYFENKLPLKVEILADKNQMEKVVANFVDNAIKYTNSGKITVSLSQSENYLVISIKDTGIGIPESHIGRIFERFYRVDKSRSRKLGGSGLGLSIVKHIIENHNGTIEVFSELGKGTEFKIYVPFK
ncbi:MAG: HAMP domain-containing protein [Calditrichaeota bacterium]|nr:MAG: HAMP domain-containing protein [Calditrichota bacterium]